MPEENPSEQQPVRQPATAPQPCPPIPDRCRAARAGDSISYVRCLVRPPLSCEYQFWSASFIFCEHPHREAIVARTLAPQQHPAD